jgi:DNA replication and repair protein RecF
VIFQSLKLTKFRSHSTVNLSFVDGVNLIVGPNGSGKTNILEAINLLSTGKSFKAHYDHEMIYNPEIDHPFQSEVLASTRDDDVRKFARVVGEVLGDDGQETLEVVVVGGKPCTNLSQKTFKINGTPKPIYETSKYFATVLFCPQDLDLFNGSPSLRRRFLDDLLCKIDQKYKKEHAIYTKAVRQRNKILEKINKTSRGTDELAFWTDEILKTGTYLQEKRVELVEMLNNDIEQVYSEVSSKTTRVRVDYKINQINLERLQKHHEHEIYAKTTLVGPHRDDFDFLINDFSISHYGSRGQQRTGVLALKMRELDVVKQKTATSPVLLLDDIFSEFDDSHKKSMEKVIEKQQTIITSTQADIDAQKTITL